MKAIGDDQLERLQSEQGADDHLVETGQQQEHLPQATAPVVPDHSDDDPTCQRRHYSGFQAHGRGLYAVPSTSEIRSVGLRRRTGAARALGPLSCPRRLEVVAAATDSASRCTHDRQDQTDEEHDDSDGPEDRNLEQKSGDEQDNSKDDHGCEAFLSARLPAREPDRSSGCSTLISVKYP